MAILKDGKVVEKTLSHQEHVQLKGKALSVKKEAKKTPPDTQVETKSKAKKPTL